MKNIEQMATQIACAELTNGHRTHWVYEWDDKRLKQLALASAKLAQFIHEETQKICTPTEGVKL